MSCRVYPVTQTRDVCRDYRVFINGEEAALNTARVSAVPFNRRWPGHQRQKEQTELVNFLSMAMSGPVEVKILPAVKSSKVEIRPISLGVTPRVNPDGSIEFTLPHPAKFSVEPYGTGRALHVFADEEKDYGVDFNHPDVLYFGAGEHHPGLIRMKSGQTLFIDEGAVVYATIDACGVDNIRILGRGILDNSENLEKILFEINAVGNDADVGNAERLYFMEIDHCSQVEIDGVTMRDSLCYNINFCSCRDARVKNVKLIGNWRFNSDGVHFANCIGGSLTDSFLRTYDDSVCVRGYTSEEKDRLLSVDFLDDCREILVENNVIWNDWGVGVRIGAAALSKEIRDVTVRNCDIIHITANAMDCLICDYADVHDFVYENINIELDDWIRTPVLQTKDAEQYEDFPKDADYCPALIGMQLINHYEYTNKKYNPDCLPGKVHDITFDTIRVFGRQPVRAEFSGFNREHKCENIVLRNFYQNGKHLTGEDFRIKCNAYCDNIVYETGKER